MNKDRFTKKLDQYQFPLFLRLNYYINLNMRKNTIIAIAVLLIATAIFRVGLGFSPQLAVAVFSGALFADNKKMVFLMPLLSMLISDIIFQVLYIFNLSAISGFYGIDQVVNYGMIGSIAFIGLFARNFKVTNIFASLIAAPIVFFIASNFFVWATNGGWHHPLTFSGLVACYADAVPFFKSTFYSTLVFGFIFFGAAMLSKKLQPISIKA